MEASVIPAMVRRALGQLALLGALAVVLDLFARGLLPVPGGRPWLADGVAPRELRGLPGIFIAPFHHEGPQHLYRNLVALLGLGWAILLEGRKRFWQASLFIAGVGGLIIWLTGASGHIYVGSSGVVFGYMGFAMMRAFITRRPLWIGIAVVAAACFGGRMTGLIVGTAEGGWLAHLAGFVAGIWCAAVMHRPRSVVDAHWT